MSYSRYNYSSPLGSHSYNHSSYVSPTGNNRYSSTSTYDSSRYSSRSPYGSGLSGSLSNLSSRPYSGSRLSSDYISPSSYTPSYSSSYSPSLSSSYSRDSKYLDSSYTPSYRPKYDSGYTSNYSSKTRSSDLDTSYTPRKTRAADLDVSDYTPRKSRAADLDVSDYKPSKRDRDMSGVTTKTTDTTTSSESRRKRREREKADEGSSPVPTRKAAEDVSSVTKQTDALSLESKRTYDSSAPKLQPYKPPAAESARYQDHTGDTPQYRGYTNPHIQSHSFKTLQNVIDSGQDPGSYFQKAPWQSHTVNQVANEPRKYTPSQTWAAIHSQNGSAASPAPGSYTPRQATAYHPPPAAPGPPPAAAPSPATHNLRNFGQQMHSPQKYGYLFDTRTPSPAKSAADPTKPFVPAGSPARTTEVPCGDGVATKGKSAMAQQSANPDKIPVCAKCNEDIRGPFVLALNKSWCPHCFTCDKCGSELVNMGFVELNGKIYCENDYETFFAPKCAKCRQPIVGDTVNALDKTWHPACFVCQECGSPISSGAFHVEDGMPYCMKDWQRLFQTKCTGCTFPVEPGDRWIEALDANWHSECFVCGSCRVKLEGKPFYPREGKPFCKEHAQG